MKDEMGGSIGVLRSGWILQTFWTNNNRIMWRIRPQIYEKEISQDDSKPSGLQSYKDDVALNREGEDCGDLGVQREGWVRCLLGI